MSPSRTLGSLRTPLPVAAVLVAGLAAHDPGLSSLDVTVRGGTIDAVLQIGPVDLAAGPGRTCDADGDGTVDSAELARLGGDMARRWIEVAVDERVVAWSMVQVRADDDGGAVVTYRANRAATGAVAGGFAVASPVLDELPFGHRQFTTVSVEGRTVGQVLLAASSPRARWSSVVEKAARPRAPLHSLTPSGSMGTAATVPEPTGPLEQRPALPLVLTITLGLALAVAARAGRLVPTPRVRARGGGT